MFYQTQDIIKRRFFLKSLIIISMLFSGYVMVSLISFHPSDPSWLQTSCNEPIHNLGGEVGAWFSDILFLIFGVVAYAIPLLSVTFCQIIFWKEKKNYESFDYFFVSLRLIGVLTLVISTCSLVELSIDDLYYFSSGGMIGSLFSNLLLLYFSLSTVIVCLFFIWGIGFTIFTSYSWLLIAEKIGFIVFNAMKFIFCYRNIKDFHN